MSLRGKQPDAIDKRLKLLIFGQAGAGKTTAAIQFPKPYIIDTEHGAENAQYLEIIKEKGGAIYQTTSFDEVLNEIRALMVEQHDYKTLVIDPITIIYHSLLEEEELTCLSTMKVPNKNDLYGRHYKSTNEKFRRLCLQLLNLDMNVIITAHAKKEYADGMSVCGVTYDAAAILEFMFDVIINLEVQGGQRCAYVKKSRIKAIEQGSRFEFSYDVIADMVGHDILEKEAKPAELITKQQFNKLNNLLMIQNKDEYYIQKVLVKLNVASIKDLSRNNAQTWIDKLGE